MDEFLLDQIEQMAQAVYDLRAPRRRVTRRVRNRVGDRDGWICRICRKPVDRDRPWVHATAEGPAPRGANDLYPSVEHIVSVGVGGTNDEDNLGICHLVCNNRQTHPDGRQADNFTSIRAATAATQVLKAVGRIREAGVDRADELLQVSDLEWLVEFFKVVGRSAETKTVRSYLNARSHRA